MFNFKKETKVYVVKDGLRYTLDVYPDLNASQTFDETAVPVKTLHSLYSMFEKARITKANPANFNFTVPILYDADLNVLFDLLVNYSNYASMLTADYYVESSNQIYKIEYAVIDSGVFNLLKDAVTTVTISGTARKLSKFTGAIPGTPVLRSSSRMYTAIGRIDLKNNGVQLSLINNLSVEIRNDVSWTDYGTVHNSLYILDASGTLYPGAFVVSKRLIVGNYSQYVTPTTDTVNTWSTENSLYIGIYNLTGNLILEFNLPLIVFTNNLQVQDLFSRVYDFRMTHTLAPMSTIVKKYNRS